MELRWDAGRPVIEYDHYAPELVDDAQALYRGLRTEAPVAWSPLYGGFW